MLEYGINCTLFQFTSLQMYTNYLQILIVHSAGVVAQRKAVTHPRHSTHFKASLLHWLLYSSGHILIMQNFNVSCLCISMGVSGAPIKRL